MKKSSEIKKAIIEAKARSKWARGVKLYALELVENLKAAEEWKGTKAETVAELKARALNGAEDWAAYSWGGSSLIYNNEIAARLATMSEIKRTRHGERKPNAREEWLDTQARALYQAFELVKKLAR